MTSHLAPFTALLGEKLRTSFLGYAATLAPHPALGTADGSAVVVTISDPALELVAWVRRGDPDEEPWADRVVEMRVVLRASDDDYKDHEEAIAAMVGDSIGFDDELPLDEVLDAVRVLLFEELPLEIADGGPAVHLALVKAMRAYLNDPMRPSSM